MQTLTARGKRFFSRNLQMLYRNWFLHTMKNASITYPELAHPSARISDSKIQGRVNVGAQADIRNSSINATRGSAVEIGEYCGLRDVKILGAAIIGRQTSLMGPLRILSFFNPVVIGRFSSIAWYVTIQEFNHRIDQCSTASVSARVLEESKEQDLISKGAVTIGSDVWIGAQTTIVSGAAISDGAVIGANSVVTGFIPPYAVAAGSPARVIKYRFSDELIEKLLALAWWDWNDEKIKKNRGLFEGRLTSEKLGDIRN